ncbi:RloB family protein [Vibrio sp. Sgm 22]|uniref:RloB family protein n=1 Tax=unclassified Vibrio TaxID=2614977 RepID=UPI0022490E44|nr:MULTISPECIES: RloB family protein [unclassified Vibrio]MCX2759895.1 RloB family protein [Vibrio sp. 14G-20]MCX2776882.1 RloB family protein [Vibrio sp. Sgm 22]
MIDRPTKSSRSKEKKIEPITCYVICEGYKDESKYFEAIESKIKNRYQGNLIFVPIQRKTTASAPKKVFEELDEYFKENDIKIGVRHYNYAFMIIDKDHHFQDNHRAGTLNAIEACNELNVDVLINVPSFEVWEICHYKDISIEDSAYLDKLYANRKVSKKKTFSKKEVELLSNGSRYDNIVENVSAALENEAKLKLVHPCNALPPTKVQSNVGKLFKLFEDKGYVIANMFIR